MAGHMGAERVDDGQSLQIVIRPMPSRGLLLIKGLGAGQARRAGVLVKDGRSSASPPRGLPFPAALRSRRPPGPRRRKDARNSCPAEAPEERRAP